MKMEKPGSNLMKADAGMTEKNCPTCGAEMGEGMDLGMPKPQPKMDVKELAGRPKKTDSKKFKTMEDVKAYRKKKYGM